MRDIIGKQKSKKSSWGSDWFTEKPMKKEAMRDINGPSKKSKKKSKKKDGWGSDWFTGKK